MKRLFLCIALLAFVLPSAIGCGAARGDALQGTAWTAVSIDGVPVIEGSYLSLYLWPDGSVRGSAGVNYFDTSFRTEGHGIKFGVVPNSGGVTMMGGPEDLERQEESYLKGLWAATTFSVAKGILHLCDSSGSVRVTMASIVQHGFNPARLAGTEWRLDSFNGGAISDNSTMTLFIDGDSRATGQAGPFAFEFRYETCEGLIRGAFSGWTAKVGTLGQEGGTAARALTTLQDAGTYSLGNNVFEVVSTTGNTATFRLSKTDRSAPRPQAPALSLGGSEASWAYHFEDLGQLAAYSDLVVIGKGEGFVGIDLAAYGNSHIHAWKSAFRVEAVFKGSANDRLILKHPVYSYDSGGYHADETDPPVQLAERWVLFLRRGADGTYTENGPWGRYKITDDKVYSMNRVIGNNRAYYDAGLDFNGEELPKFVHRLTTTLRSMALTFYSERGEYPCPVFQFHSAGLSGSLLAKLSSGWSASGNVTFEVKRLSAQGSEYELPMPAGLRVWLEPDPLDVELDNEYRLNIKAETSPDLPSGIYWLSVQCIIEERVVAARAVTVSIWQ